MNILAYNNNLVVNITPVYRLVLSGDHPSIYAVMSECKCHVCAALVLQLMAFSSCCQTKHIGSFLYHSVKRIKCIYDIWGESLSLLRNFMVNLRWEIIYKCHLRFIVTQFTSFVFYYVFASHWSRQRSFTQMLWQIQCLFLILADGWMRYMHYSLFAFLKVINSHKNLMLT